MRIKPILSKLRTYVKSKKGNEMTAAAQKPLGLNFSSSDSNRLDKISGKGIEFTREEITPEKAIEYLRTHEDEKIAKKHYKKDAKTGVSVTAKRMAQVMKAGAYIVNGMPIMFDENGRLIDGVSRLQAVVHSGVTIANLVARNVQSDTLHTVDQHKRRNYAGTLEERGFNHAATLQRTMAALIKIENGMLGKGNVPISVQHFDRVLKANPELIEAVAIAENAQNSPMHSTARPNLAFMALKANKRQKLRDFMDIVKNPDFAELGNPARTLANQLRSDRARARAASNAGKDASRMDWISVLGVSVHAFEDFCDGKIRGDDYFWEPDYGKAGLTNKERKSGLSVNSASVRERIRKRAPANLGLPTVSGYPGLECGKFEEKAGAGETSFDGATAEKLITANDESAGEEYAEMRLVTPELARKYLGFNSKNRKLDDNHKRAIASDIKNGYWALNAQPICFTSNPDAPDATEHNVRLLNGQHRLQAIIEADMAVEVPVAINISEAAYATFDAHHKKSRMKDKEGNLINSPGMLAAARLQWKEDNGFDIYGVGVRPTASQLRATILWHKDMRGFLEKAMKMNDVGQAGMLTYFMYHIHRDRPDLAEQFMKDLETGEGLASQNPVLKARTVVVGIRSNDAGPRVRIPRKKVLAIYMDAWEKYKTFKDEEAQDSKEDLLL